MFIKIFAVLCAVASPLLVAAAIKFFMSGLGDTAVQTFGLALLLAGVPLLVKAFNKASADIYEK